MNYPRLSSKCSSVCFKPRKIRRSWQMPSSLFPPPKDWLRSLRISSEPQWSGNLLAISCLQRPPACIRLPLAGAVRVGIGLPSPRIETHEGQALVATPSQICLRFSGWKNSAHKRSLTSSRTSLKFWVGMRKAREQQKKRASSLSRWHNYSPSCSVSRLPLHAGCSTAPRGKHEVHILEYVCNVEPCRSCQ